MEAFPFAIPSKLVGNLEDVPLSDQVSPSFCVLVTMLYIQLDYICSSGQAGYCWMIRLASIWFGAMDAFVLWAAIPFIKMGGCCWLHNEEMTGQEMEPTAGLRSYQHRQSVHGWQTAHREHNKQRLGDCSEQ
jgi:hypothetical protein